MHGLKNDKKFFLVLYFSRIPYTTFYISTLENSIVCHLTENDIFEADMASWFSASLTLVVVKV